MYIMDLENLYDGGNRVELCKVLEEYAVEKYLVNCVKSLNGGGRLA